jgi:hypothetical protein
MRPVPNRAPKLGKVAEATRKAASAELNASMGKFKTGAIKSRAEKRNNTRADKKKNAIREDLG